MDKRDSLREQKKLPGPVVTVSREYGCESQHVVMRLLTLISGHYEHDPQHNPWKYVNKEIIEESAKELKIMPHLLEERVLSHKVNPTSDIFSGFSFHYDLSDQKVIDTVRDIVETYSRSGNVIIVGRGGTQLTQHIPHSLHIKLMAPLRWRIKKIAASKQITPQDAEKLIHKVDGERILWSEHLSDEAYDEGIFDIIVNRKTFTIEETAQLILNRMIQKGMLQKSRTS